MNELDQLVTVSALARRLDCARQTAERKLEAAHVQPDATTAKGFPLYRLARLEELQRIVANNAPEVVAQLNHEPIAA